MTSSSEPVPVDPRPLMVLVTGDLFLGSRLKGFGESAGFRVQTVVSCEKAIALGAERPAKVVIDLMAPGMDVSQLVASLGQCSVTDIAAYAPHVRTDLLRGARAAGVPLVFTRSQLEDRLPAWLASR